MRKPLTLFGALAFASIALMQLTPTNAVSQETVSVTGKGCRKRKPESRYR